MSKIVDIIANAIFEANGQILSKDEIKNLLKDIDECKVKVWRENKNVKLPTYSKDGDACMDVYVHSVEKKSDGRIVYHTGLHFALPEDYEMVIRPRSGITKTFAVMQNSPGTLDGGYRGELMIVQRSMIDPDLPRNEYMNGDRIAQTLVRRRERIIWDEVNNIDDLGTTERGIGGFGSTGK